MIFAERLRPVDVWLFVARADPVKLGTLKDVNGTETYDALRQWQFRLSTLELPQPFVFTDASGVIVTDETAEAPDDVYVAVGGTKS